VHPGDAVAIGELEGDGATPASGDPQANRSPASGTSASLWSGERTAMRLRP